MTVTYSAEVSTVRGRYGVFWKLLYRWRGSIYKLLWPDMILYTVVYFTLSFTYRFALSENGKRYFEKAALHCRQYSDLIPVSFILGFYVGMVLKRWWEQYNSIPWPDSLAMYVSSCVHGEDERGLLMRRTIMRYAHLSFTLSLTMMCSQIKKRFPSFDHFVEAGMMTEQERSILVEIEKKTNYRIFWVPLVWSTSVVTRARKEGRVRDDFAMTLVHKEIGKFWIMLVWLLTMDWVCIPLVYTQVVTLAVYTFVFASLMGRQYLDPNQELEGFETDYYIPVFPFLQFFFYMGWLRVAESMVNPFGEDDDDFEINWLIDRNLQVSYLIVDEMHNDHPELIRDQYWEEIFPVELPYTVAAEQFRSQAPLGSTAVLDEELAERPLTKTEHKSILSAVNEEDGETPQTRKTLSTRIHFAQLHRTGRDYSKTESDKDHHGIDHFPKQAEGSRRNKLDDHHQSEHSRVRLRKSKTAVHPMWSTSFDTEGHPLLAFTSATNTPTKAAKTYDMWKHKKPALSQNARGQPVHDQRQQFTLQPSENKEHQIQFPTLLGPLGTPVDIFDEPTTSRQGKGKPSSAVFARSIASPPASVSRAMLPTPSKLAVFSSMLRRGPTQHQKSPVPSKKIVTSRQASPPSMLTRPLLSTHKACVTDIHKPNMKKVVPQSSSKKVDLKIHGLKTPPRTVHGLSSRLSQRSSVRRYPGHPIFSSPLPEEDEPLLGSPSTESFFTPSHTESMLTTSRRRQHFASRMTIGRGLSSRPSTILDEDESICTDEGFSGTSHQEHMMYPIQEPGTSPSDDPSSPVQKRRKTIPQDHEISQEHPNTEMWWRKGHGWIKCDDIEDHQDRRKLRYKLRRADVLRDEWQKHQVQEKKWMQRRWLQLRNVFATMRRRKSLKAEEELKKRAQEMRAKREEDNRRRRVEMERHRTEMDKQRIEMDRQRAEMERLRQRAEEERQRAETERKKLEMERQRLEVERMRAAVRHQSRSPSLSKSPTGHAPARKSQGK